MGRPNQLQLIENRATSYAYILPVMVVHEDWLAAHTAMEAEAKRRRIRLPLYLRGYLAHAWRDHWRRLAAGRRASS
jgi:hypothetical protein